MKWSAALRLPAIAGLCLLTVSAAADAFPSKSGPISVVTVAEGLEHPWGLAFLPDGRMLVTERPGRIRVVDPDGHLSKPIAGMPDVYARGEGGLLDVALDPAFATNRLIYFAFAEPGAGGAATSVGRAKLAGDRLEQLKIIFRQRPKVEGSTHFGARLLFLRDGTLLVTLGDRNARDLIADLKTDLGKIVRLNPDGTIPGDNPFVGRADAAPELYSLGHRNVQGAAIDPQTGELWTSEHGARGGDEINVPKPGRNYGWDVISYGTEYSGGKIGEGTSKPGLEQPIYYWDPSIAPSGITFYDGDRFPAWRGNLFVAALKFRMLVRLQIEGHRVVSEERLLEGMGDRLRDVVQGPDGFLYLLTDEADGRILRIEPGR
jgi:glucose/arabinose dehydrogenase